jgi:hypothetical protein
MIHTVLRERATGQSAPMWFGDKMELAEKGLTGEAVLIVLNSDPFLGNALGFYPSDPLEQLTVTYYTGMTDPDANFRVRDSHLLAWSQNLSNLGTVARMVIPGLRELTQPEQDGLRQYRKRLFRKV